MDTTERTATVHALLFRLSPDREFFYQQILEDFLASPKETLRSLLASLGISDSDIEVRLVRNLPKNIPVDNKKRLGWGMPTGGKLPDETSLEAAARESEEEGGFEQGRLRALLQPVSPDDQPGGNPIKVNEDETHEWYLFATPIDRAWGDPRTNDPETEGTTDARWVPLSVLLEPEQEIFWEGEPIYNSHRKLIAYCFEGRPMHPPFWWAVKKQRREAVFEKQSCSKTGIKIPRPPAEANFNRRKKKDWKR